MTVGAEIKVVCPQGTPMMAATARSWREARSRLSPGLQRDPHPGPQQ